MHCLLGDTDMGGEFGLKSKGRTLENIKKSKEGVGE